jgi:hypothetical protein
MDEIIILDCVDILLFAINQLIFLHSSGCYRRYAAVRLWYFGGRKKANQPTAFKTFLVCRNDEM